MMLPLALDNLMGACRASRNQPAPGGMPYVTAHTLALYNSHKLRSVSWQTSSATTAATPVHVSGLHCCAFSRCNLPGDTRQLTYKLLPIYETTHAIAGPAGNESSRFLLLFCHRGQMSNRVLCMQRGARLARLLRRQLVFPLLADGPAGAIDTSRYLDMTCFRRVRT